MKHSRMTLGMVVFLSAAMTLQADWTTKRLSYEEQDSRNPDVALWGENAYFVWQADSPGNYEIYFKKATDGGASWKSAKPLTNNDGDSENPAIAVLGSKIFVVWQDDTPDMVNDIPEIYFKRSTDGGETWLATQRLTNNTGRSEHPAVAVSGSTVYVVWTDDSPGKRDVYLRISTDGGETWQAARRLTISSEAESRPDIAVDGANVYVVWYRYYTPYPPDPGNYDVYFRKSEDSGANWTPSRRLTTTTTDSSVAEIAVDGDDVYVTWFEFVSGDDGEICLKHSATGGETWSSTRQLTNNATESHAAAIAFRDASVHIAWMEEMSSDSEIFYRKSVDSGENWNTAFNLSNNAGNSCNPNIAVNDISLFVVWYDIVLGKGEIIVKFKPA